MNLEIRPLASDADVIRRLSDLIVEVVAGGASVSFMHPLTYEDAATFWMNSLAAAGLGKRIILGAFANEELAGTVTLNLDMPPNQPHRAEIAKLMTATRFRRNGVGSELMAEAERSALAARRTMLTLDTATEDGAAPFYEKMGYVAVGTHPDFALTPFGAMCGTIFYYKRLVPAAERLPQPESIR